MKRILLVASLLVTFGLFAFAADTSIAGTINDAKCGAKMIDAACAQKCAAAGEPMVLIADKGNKVYKIANQDAIKDHIGHHVTITGTVKGDTITITKVTMTAAPAGKSGL